MKKSILFLLAAFALAFFSCSSDEDDDNAASSTRFTKGTDSSVLVAYYSDTGNTKSVAQKIANYLGADLLEIESANSYTSSDLNYGNSSSRVSTEHAAIFGSKSASELTTEDLAKVDTKVDSDSVVDLSGYSTIFIGYPIWWGIAAWPVNGFVTQNDLSGKQVAPFCTSSSSGLGRSAELLQSVSGNKGNWLTGRRFSGSATESDVKSWVDSLGIK